MGGEQTIQLRDICEALDVSDRDARYVLERGHVPKGVYVKPASGNHRQFSRGQAIWLGIILKLKANDISTPIGVKIADYALRCIQTVTQSLGWESTFLPSHGRLDTENSYKVEIADLTFIRFGTDAGPSTDGYEWFDWHLIEKPGVAVGNIIPYVLLSVDLAHISRQLSRAFKKQR